MYAANGYVGSAQDAARIRRQEKEREEQRKKFEEQQKQQRDKVANAGLKQFGSSKAEAYEAAFKSETVGLVTREEFMAKRNTIAQRLQEEEAREKAAAEAAAAADKERRKREKAKAKARAKLSFLGGDDDEDEEEEAAEGAVEEEAGRGAAGAGGSGGDGAGGSGGDNNTAGPSDEQQQQEQHLDRAASGAAAGPSAPPAAKRPKIGKDPSVRTDFLPDRDREAYEEELRAKLKREWLAQQEAVKNEPLEVTYSYWDGSGHRRKVTVRKGDSIGAFLKAAREQLAPEFRELRALGADALMYIKVGCVWC
jgi:protein FAM50